MLWIKLPHFVSTFRWCKTWRTTSIHWRRYCAHGCSRNYRRGYQEYATLSMMLHGLIYLSSAVRHISGATIPHKGLLCSAYTIENRRRYADPRSATIHAVADNCILDWQQKTCWSCKVFHRLDHSSKCNSKCGHKWGSEHVVICYCEVVHFRETTCHWLALFLYCCVIRSCSW